MKIALVLPYDSVYRFKQGTFAKAMLYPPLTLTTLAALVPPQLHADIEIFDEGSRQLETVLATAWRETYRFDAIIRRSMRNPRNFWLTLPIGIAFRKHALALSRALHLRGGEPDSSL